MEMEEDELVTQSPQFLHHVQLYQLLHSPQFIVFIQIY